MNTPVDFKDAAALNKHRQVETGIVFSSGVTRMDMMDIRVYGFEGKYQLSRSEFVSTMNLSGEIRFHQGELNCVIGKHGRGKDTLLKLLGGDFVRGSEDVHKVFVPAHLRTLLIQHPPCFLGGTLYENLTLGCDGILPGEVGDRSRVQRVCKRLGLPDHITDLLQECKIASDEPIHDWSNTLSNSECHLLSLARALVVNFEFLIIPKPTLHLNPDAIEKVLSLLVENVTDRGVEMNRTQKHLWEPRTVLISDNSLDQSVTRKCDQVFSITDKGVQLLSADTFDDSFSKNNKEGYSVSC